MTARGFERCCTHAFRYKALQLWLNRMIFGGNDVPAWLRFPSSSRYLLAKQIRNRSRLSCPNELLFLFREIAGKRRHTVGLKPDASIADIDVGKYVRGRKLFLQALCGLVFVRPECGQVDEAHHTRVSAGCCNDRSTV